MKRPTDLFMMDSNEWNEYVIENQAKRIRQLENQLQHEQEMHHQTIQELNNYEAEIQELNEMLGQAEDHLFETQNERHQGLIYERELEEENTGYIEEIILLKNCVSIQAMEMNMPSHVPDAIIKLIGKFLKK